MDLRSVNMCIDASNRLNLFAETIDKHNNELDNCGNLSHTQRMLDLKRAEKRVLEYVNTLIGKESSISIPHLSRTLLLAEDVITVILERNGMNVYEGEDEEE